MKAHAAVLVTICANDADKPIPTQLEQLFSWTLAPVFSKFFSQYVTSAFSLIMYSGTCRSKPFNLFPEFCDLYVRYSAYRHCMASHNVAMEFPLQLKTNFMATDT